jgi:hypothetical protein
MPRWQWQGELREQEDHEHGQPNNVWWQAGLWLFRNRDRDRQRLLPRDLLGRGEDIFDSRRDIVCVRSPGDRIVAQPFGSSGLAPCATIATT